MKKPPKPLIFVLFFLIVITHCKIDTYATNLSFLSSRSNSSYLSGIFYFQSVKYDKCMQIDNGAGPDYDGDGEKMELFNIDGADYQKWSITHISNGYYKIISVKSSKALSVKSGKTSSDQVALIQEEFNNESRQLWSITEIGSNKYIIRPQSNTDFCMAAGDGLFSSGRNVEHRIYEENDEKNQWYICPIFNYWYSDANECGYWASRSVSLYAQQNYSAPNFYFSDGLQNAKTQWANALDIHWYSSSSESADIRIFAKDRQTIQSEGHIFDTNTLGLTEWNTYPNNDNPVYYGTAPKTIQQMYWADIYIAPLENLNRGNQFEVIMHEFGHALGFSGHSSYSTDVMYPYNHSQYFPTSNDVTHLRQFYDYYIP